MEPLVLDVSCADISIRDSIQDKSDVTSASTDSRLCFGEELSQDRVFYDDRGEVLERLLSGNSTHLSGDAILVDQIGRIVEVERKADLEQIRDIARKTLDCSENNWLGTPAYSARVENRELEEALFEPLTRIIDTVDRALSDRLGDRKRKYYRQFVCTAHCKPPLVYPQDDNLEDRFGSPFRCGEPDFSIVERPRPLNGGALLKRPTKPVEARHLVSYMVVKNCIFDSPSLPLGQVQGNTTLSEAIEYARSLLACLPFQLYVYGLIVCGSAFWLTWTDRAGVVLSPQYSLLENAGLRTFIRIVLRLTWEMSPSELGQDPNTEYVRGHKSLSRSDYPALLVKMPLEGPDSKLGSWTTWGDPVSLPRALFGRGTSVWRVWADEGHPAILKVAWTPVSHLTELEIYRRMKDIIESAHMTIPGIVKLDSVIGGDVHFMPFPVKGTSHLQTVPVTVSALRPQNTVPRNMVDMRLQRVILTDLGKPLWKYQSPEELVRSMRMALVAHRDLCSLGILHRNINAQSVLIRLSPESETGVGVEKTEGFLTDFEFATLPHSDSDSKTEAAQTAPRDSDVMDSGTAVFMASSLLQSLKDSAELGEVVNVSRTKEHDIESFLWVFVFAVYKHGLEDAAALIMMPHKRSKGLKKEFEEIFPVSRGNFGRCAESILRARLSLLSSTGYKHIVAYIENYVRDTHPEHLSSLFMLIWDKFLAGHLPSLEMSMEDNLIMKYALEMQLDVACHFVQPPPPPPLTHEAVLALFDVYLQFIRKEP